MGKVLPFRPKGTPPLDTNLEEGDLEEFSRALKDLFSESEIEIITNDFEGADYEEDDGV